MIANACLLKESKLVRIGCTFLLVADTENNESDSDDSDNERPFTKIIGAKKTKARLNSKQRAVEHYEKRIRRKERKFDNKEPSFLTIDQLKDPQKFVEDLLYNLKHVFGKGNHELQVIMLQVMARIVGRHKLMLYELYPFIQKFITPKSKKVTQMLIICAEATHELVNPNELHPVIKKIMDNFLSEHCSEEFIVLGLNCLREISKRQPLIMTKELLDHISTFKSFKNKSVVIATSGLINLFKEIRPSLLRKKLREGEVDLVGEYGEVKVCTRVPGAELLEEKYQKETLGNQQVVILQPQQKSENLQRLELALQRRQNLREDSCRKIQKIREDLDDEKKEVEEESDESESQENKEDSDENEEDSDENEEDSDEICEDSNENEEVCEDSEEDEELVSDSQENSEESIEKDDEIHDTFKESHSDREILQKDLTETNENVTYTSTDKNFPYECDRILTQNDFKRIKQLRKEAEARRKRIDIALLNDSDDESNEFLEDEDLETMKMTKEEKLKLSAEEKTTAKHKRKAKKGGKTNKEHAKCKPAMMVMKKKKQSMREKFETVKRKIRRSKQQLGKFSKRFNSTKRSLK